MPIDTIGAVLADQYVFWWIAQLVAVFIIVILVVRWRPGFLSGRTIGETLRTTLDARAEQIQHQLEAAERSRQEADRIRKEAETDISKARAEAEDIVSRASHTSEAIQKEMHERSQEEFQRIVGQAKTEIEYERQQAEMALRRQAADIVIDASREIVERHHESSADARLINTALGRMEKLS